MIITKLEIQSNKNWGKVRKATYHWICEIVTFNFWVNDISFIKKSERKNTFQLFLLSFLFSYPFEQQQLKCSEEGKRSLGSEKNTFMSCFKKRNSLLKQSLCYLIVFKRKKEKSVLVVWKMMKENGGWEKGLVLNKTWNEECE